MRKHEWCISSNPLSTGTTKLDVMDCIPINPMHYNVILLTLWARDPKKLVVHSDFLLIAMQTKNIMVNEPEV